MEKEKKPKSKVRKIIEWVLTGIVATIFLVVAIGQITGMMNRDANYGQSLPYGFGNFVVQTDSMEPEYPVGTAIVTHKDDPADIYAQWEKINHSTTKESHIDMTFFDNYTGSYTKAQEIPELASVYNEETSNVQTVMTHRLRYILVNEDVELGLGRYLFYVAGTNISEHQSGAGQYQVFSEKELLGVVKINSPVLGGFFSFVASPWGLLVLLLIPAMYLIVTSGMDIIRALKEKDKEDESYVMAGGPDNPDSSLAGFSKEDQERLKAEMLQEMLYGKKDDTVDSKTPVIKEEPTVDENSTLNDISSDDQERLKAEMLAEMMKEDQSLASQVNNTVKKDMPSETKKVDTTPNNDVLGDISKEDQERLKAEMLAEMMKNNK